VTECAPRVVQLVAATTTDACLVAGLEHTGTVIRVLVVRQENILHMQVQLEGAQIVLQDHILLQVQRHVPRVQLANKLHKAQVGVVIVHLENFQVLEQRRVVIVEQERSRHGLAKRRVGIVTTGRIKAVQAKPSVNVVQSENLQQTLILRPTPNAHRAMLESTNLIQDRTRAARHVQQGPILHQAPLHARAVPSIHTAPLAVAVALHVRRTPSHLPIAELPATANAPSELPGRTEARANCAR